jgi:succinate-semialdehyde dehydrogenase / glutarate-semialdehyde dehydrogenase
MLEIRVSTILKKERLANRINSGMVNINHLTWTQADLPFGGTKGSGYGRELAQAGLSEFVNKKLIRVSELSNPF